MKDIDRIGKLVALAKNGYKGEKTAAERLLRRICERDGLDFDEVMSDDEPIHTFELAFRGNVERQLLGQVIYKFALTKDHARIAMRGRNRLVFECTMRQFIETQYAWVIYRRAFRKEKDKLVATVLTAFTHKHNIFRSQGDLLGFERDPTMEDWDRINKAKPFMEGMEDIHLKKAIGAGNE